MNIKFKTFLAGVLTLSFAAAQPAKAEGLMDYLKDYGIPCALSIGLSAALVKNDGAMVGTAICAGVSSATYLSKKRSLDEEKLKFAAEQAVAKESEERDIRIKEHVEVKIEELRDVLREVLAERLVKMEEDLRLEVEKKLQEGNILQKLEERLTAKVKEEVSRDGKERSKELVKEAVEEVIRQVVARPVATPNREE